MVSHVKHLIYELDIEFIVNGFEDNTEDNDIFVALCDLFILSEILDRKDISNEFEEHVKCNGAFCFSSSKLDSNFIVSWRILFFIDELNIFTSDKFKENAEDTSILISLCELFVSNESLDGEGINNELKECAGYAFEGKFSIFFSALSFVSFLVSSS